MQMVMFPMYQPSISLRLQCATSISLAQRSLTNKTSYVHKELYIVIFSAQQRSAQRDHFV